MCILVRMFVQFWTLSSTVVNYLCSNTSLTVPLAYGLDIEKKSNIKEHLENLFSHWTLSLLCPMGDGTNLSEAIRHSSHAFGSRCSMNVLKIDQEMIHLIMFFFFLSTIWWPNTLFIQIITFFLFFSTVDFQYWFSIMRYCVVSLTWVFSWECCFNAKRRLHSKIFDLNSLHFELIINAGTTTLVVASPF